ncbi:MAG: hypothetical protein KJ666_10670 [Bacteroidetes bacterium]|nr:hypothetical protein [Bacteroidota bacterium]MBU2586342.1 hypothetical protein [Bacteroidota bacterium]
MKRKIFVLLLISVFLSSSDCKKDESPTGSEFQNKLTLGTGMTGFVLVGESTSFTMIGSSLNLYFRLEAKDDMAGSNVQIKIEKSTTSGYSHQQTFTFEATQSYGHIMLSSFGHTFGKGEFKASGILVNGNKFVASINYIVN